MHGLLPKLGSLLLTLLRLPFDLLFLGYDFLRLSLWLLCVRPLRRYDDPTNRFPLPQACAASASVRYHDKYAQLCGPARKYGSPWLYRLLCHSCAIRRASEGGRRLALCRCSGSFKVPLLRQALVGLALLAFYLMAARVAWWGAERLTQTRPTASSAIAAPIRPTTAPKPEDALVSSRATDDRATDDRATDDRATDDRAPTNPLARATDDRAAAAAPVPTNPVVEDRSAEGGLRRLQALEQLEAARKLRESGKTAEARLAFEAAGTLDEGNLEAQMGLAECACELALYPEARQAAGRALRLDANCVPAYLALARVERAAGKLDAATEQAKRALSLSPANVEAMLLLSTCHSAAGRHGEAVEKAQGAIALDPQNPSASLTLADAELARQNLAEAEKHYRRALELNAGLLSARTGLARTLRLRGDYGAAIGMLNEVLAGAPDAAEATMELAEVHVAQGKQRAAIGLLRDLRQKQPLIYPARARLAQLLMQSGKTNEGYVVAKELLADDPDNVAAHIILADAFLRHGFPSLAVEHCRAVLTRNANLVVAIKLLTRACLATGEYGDGSASISRVVEQCPADLEARILLAFCHEGMGKEGKCTELLEAAATAFPTSSVPLVELGTIYRRRGDPVAAAEAYDRALARTPGNPVVLHSRAALILDSNGDNDQALELALKAAKLLPANPAVADTLGWAYCRRGEYEKALERLVYAAMQKRDDPTIRYHLAVALYGKGEAAKAREQLQQALALDQDFPAAEDAAALLGKIPAEPKAVAPEPAP